MLNWASILPIRQIIGSKRLRWFGHVSKMPEDRLPKYLLAWKPKHSKQSRGRPRKHLNDVLIEDAVERLNGSEIKVDDMKGMAADCKLWRYLSLTHSSTVHVLYEKMTP